MTLSREALLTALTDAIARPDEALARVPDGLRRGPTPVLLSERQITAAVEAVMALQRERSRRRADDEDPDATERVRVALLALDDEDLGNRGRIVAARAVLRGDAILRGAR